ncbi:protein TWIN LOV 1 [Dorcoceras hygrometricum]|uniref:Protein TWIN LOV 1 n=1 Tax=Dorcoceras hygrometricum TaxID=472368 RepID=A0A2Z7DKI9_9LAMI|nr:protein TWIN LOV 1 [Dorcoceras hygrometricum]
MESPLGLIEQSFDLRYTGWVREALDELPDSFTITDPCISGHPIVFASNGFLKMFGYSRDEVIGRNGRMFQGPETDRRSVMLIREAIRNERAMEISLLNYRKDGTPFWMLFQICPVFSKEEGRVIHFVGVQVPILRKPRQSGLLNRRSEMNLSEDGGGICGSMLRCCRREVYSDSALELGHSSALGLLLNHEVEINESCEASELQKSKAAAAINRIFSVLIQYSELIGKVVSRQRCCFYGNRRLDASLNLSLGRIKQSFVLTDASLTDMPIVYASEAFLKLTGYGRHEVLGQNCRFLSGTDTDPSTQYQMKECIQTEQACTVRVLNYRKDRTPFWNFLHISPVRNASGKRYFTYAECKTTLSTAVIFDKRCIHAYKSFHETFGGAWLLLLLEQFDYFFLSRAIGMEFFFQGSNDFEVIAIVRRIILLIDLWSHKSFILKLVLRIQHTQATVAYFVGIQIDDGGTNQETHELSPHIRQLSVVGAVKVAVRSLSMGASTS